MDDSSDGSHDGNLEMDNLPSDHPAMIAARKRSNKAWQGEEMELQHAVVSKRLLTSSAAAVDLNQFRNTEVGQGYQAKHVVRQRTGVVEKADDKTVEAVQETTTRRAASSSECDIAKSKKTVTKEDLLANKGLRDFRKEIESILSDP
jgi:hypothetical protein